MNLFYYLKLIRRKFVINIKWLSEYKLNIVLLILTTLIELLFYFAFWRIIFLNNTTFNGWEFNDVLGFLGILYVFFALVGPLNWNINNFYHSIQYGFFDNYITYPYNPLFHVFFRMVGTLTLIRNSIIGLILLIISQNTIMEIVSALSIAIMGFVIFILLHFIGACLTFWMIKGGSFLESIIHSIDRVIRYPITLTNRKFQFLFTFIIPIIFIITIPAETLRGNFNFIWIVYELMILAILIFLARVVWRAGLRRYESGMG